MIGVDYVFPAYFSTVHGPVFTKPARGEVYEISINSIKLDVESCGYITGEKLPGFNNF